jgi:PAS domain S-box-containing protein
MAQEARSLPNIGDLKLVDQDSGAHLRFLENLDRINQAMHSTHDLEKMMSDVLGVTLSIFGCDRVWLVYPCDPNADSWRVPMERTKPEYPGSHAWKLEFEMDADIADAFRTQLETDGPLKAGPGTGRPVLDRVLERFGFKSLIAMAVYPKGDKPWLFGLHQCSYAREWTLEEERLFQEIGRRLSDGLTSLLAYRSLQDSEAKYRMIVETAAEGVWLLGADSETIFVNSRLADMLEYSIEELNGRIFTEFVFAEDMRDHQLRMDNRRRGVKETFERRLRRKDGQTVWVLISATPLFDEKYRFKGSFAMLTDITTRKQAEAELIMAKESAENSSRFKSRFLDIAAHELRTPVTAFSLMLELAQRQVNEGLPFEPAVLDRIQKQTKRLSRLVVEILDVSRLDRGILTVQRMQINIVPLIVATIEEISLLSPKRKIFFAKPEQSIEAHADPMRIQQVLANLLDNAERYTPEGNPIEVTVESDSAGVRISVIDHGVGISKEQQAELFSPFLRGNSDREMMSSGLGLGLFICQKIIELHHGTIGVESNAGKGSTFYFELPHRELVETLTLSRDPHGKAGILPAQIMT